MGFFSSKKTSTSNNATTNNDNRQVNDAGGGEIVTGGQNNSKALTISGTGNSVSFVLGEAQAKAADMIDTKATTGHEVTKAAQAQAAGFMSSESGKWGIVAAVAVLALAWKVAR